MNHQPPPSRTPFTQAVRRALHSVNDCSATDDLLFLEAWEMHRPHDLALTFRFGQIRRANRALAEEIQAELKTR